MSELRPNTTVSVDDTLTGNGSVLNNINLLQPTAFKLVIDRKNFNNLEFFCQAVAHPSLEVPASELPWRQVGNIPMPGDKLIFSTVEAIILVDENMNAYTEMYNWLQRTVGSNNVPAVEALRSAKAPSTVDMTLLILTSHNNVARKIHYRDCVPVSLGTMMMESTTGDTTVMTFPATFRFSYFEFE